jgi:PadR family transcriptional regulator, regulatory protein PadR
LRDKGPSVRIRDMEPAARDTDVGDATLALGHLRRELARGTAELAVLSVLARGRLYGYALLKKLQDVRGAEFEVKEGTLYPLLHRLEDAGHITGEWHSEGRVPPRKYYVLTSSGKARLELLVLEWRNLIASVQRLLEMHEAQP